MPGPASRAHAREVGARIAALTSVQARLVGTAALLHLAISTAEARGTRALVTSGTTVMARGSVLARAVVGAVIEVLVAEQTTPAIFTIATPGVGARAVGAVGVTTTLVTELALPATHTLAFVWLIAVSVLLMTTRQTNSFSTIISSPSRQALPGAIRHTLVMAERRVDRALAEDVARLPVIVLVALDSVVKVDGVLGTTGLRDLPGVRRINIVLFGDSIHQTMTIFEAVCWF